VVTKTDRVVAHFFHRGFERCRIMDKHLVALTTKYPGTRFIKISAPVRLPEGAVGVRGRWGWLQGPGEESWMESAPCDQGTCGVRRHEEAALAACPSATTSQPCSLPRLLAH
jgi:hypothetical protein